MLACCKLGLDRPLIPTAFAADLFRSATVSRPRRSADRRSPGDAATVGDWESVGRRGRAGQETTGRTSLRGAWFKPRSGGRSQPGVACHRSPRWDNQIPCLVPHTCDGGTVVRGLVSTRRGSEASETNAPFWPGACATNLRFACPFGSWLQGPGVNLQWSHGDEAVEDVLRDV